MNLADTIVQSLHGSQSVRYATVVGSTGTGAQVSIGGDTIEVAYVGDIPPEVGKRAVLVSSNGSLLCIGTTTTREPEWTEPQRLVVPPLRRWRTALYSWNDDGWTGATPEAWGSLVRGANAGQATTRDWTGDKFVEGIPSYIALGVRHLRFAVFYPDLTTLLPPGAEVTDITLRLYSTLSWSQTIGGGGSVTWERVPQRRYTPTAVLEGVDLEVSTTLSAGRDTPFPALEAFPPREVVTLPVGKDASVPLEDDWMEAMVAGNLRALAFDATGGAWCCWDMEPPGYDPNSSTALPYGSRWTTNDNLNLIVTYRTPVTDGEE